MKSYLSILLLPPSLLKQHQDGIPDVDAGLARVIAVLCRIEPHVPMWPRLLEAYVASTAPKRTHHSAIRPSHPNALFGSTNDFKLISAIAGGMQVPDDHNWSLVATLVAAPTIKEHLKLGPPSGEPPEKLLTWLRNAHHPGREREMCDALGGAMEIGEIPVEDLPDSPWPVRDLRMCLARAKQTYLAGLEYAPRTRPQVDELGLLRQVGDQETNPLDEGLAPEDLGLVRLEVPDAVDDEGEVSSATLSAVRIGTANVHAHLPLHVSLATSEELKVAAISVKDALAAGPHSGALGVGLAMVTGCDLLDLALAPVLDSVDEAKRFVERQPCVLLWQADRLFFLQQVRRPPQAFRRGAVVEEHFLPCSSHVVQEIPQALASRAPDQPLPCLAAAHPRVVESAREFAAALRAKTLGRQHIGRLRRALCAPIMSLTQDECKVQVVLPAAGVAAGAGSYYSAITVLEAFQIHQRAANDLFASEAGIPAWLDAYGDSTVGSEVSVRVDALREDLTRLRGATDEAARGRRTAERVIEAFNTISRYTLAVLQVLTAHRHTLDGFGAWRNFSSDLTAVAISDKVFDDRTSLRIVPLPSVATEQLRVLRRTTQVAADLLMPSHPELAQALRGSLHATHPAFSMLEKTRGGWRLRPAIPMDWLAHLDAWSQPPNTNRHALIQALQRMGASRELISFLVGHAEPGQAMHTAACSATPREVMEALRGHLNSYAELLQVKASRYLRPYAQGRVTSSRSSCRDATSRRHAA
ncbi:hypothetical protein GCM10028862_03230 [Luteimonas pelagia]